MAIRGVGSLCGTRPRHCPPGTDTGDPIAPDSGYGFDGLVRNTGVAVDPSGNVWLANNWLLVPFQTNPGGHQIVAYLGLAEPVKTPIIGPPRRYAGAGLPLRCWGGRSVLAAGGVSTGKT